MSRLIQRLLAQFAGAALIAGLLITMAAAPAHAGSVRETEPNDTTAKAQRVALGATIEGTFGPESDCDNGMYDCDVYRFTAPSQGRLVLDLRFSDSLGTEGTVTVSVRNSEGKTISEVWVGAGEFDGKGLRSIASYVDAGDFYVEIKSRTDYSMYGNHVFAGHSYTLTASVSPAAAETELNSTTASADVISLGRSVAGSILTRDWDTCRGSDCDYYRLRLESPSRVSLDFTFPCDLGTDQVYDISTYDNWGTQLSSHSLMGSDCAGQGIRSEIIAVPAGNFYVKVEASLQWMSWGEPYLLTVRGAVTPATPTISGTPTFGKTLTAKPGSWGPAGLTLGYQWLRDGKAIAGATTATYKLTAADVKHKISVKVTGSKVGYATASKTSAAKTVAAAKFTKTPTPKISGTAKVKKTLTAKPGKWAPSDVKLAYQWYRNGKKISGATKSTYKLVKADKGKKITVKVTATKAGYTKVIKASGATQKVK